MAVQAVPAGRRDEAWDVPGSASQQDGLQLFRAVNRGFSQT